MADTVRTKSQLKTIFADNTSGDITAQDMRDFVETVFNHDDSTSNPHSVTAAQVGAVGTATAINSGDGLTGGGTLTTSRTLSVDINGATSATVATDDELLIADTDDASNIKKCTVQGILDLAAAADPAISVENNGSEVISDATTLNFSTGLDVVASGSAAQANISINDSEIDHDSLQNYVANEHIDHSSVDITAGDGLSGGGDITTSRTLAVDINGATSATVSGSDEILIADADDANSIKKTTAQAIANLADTVFTADGSFAAYQGGGSDAGAGSSVGALAQGTNATANGNYGSFAQGNGAITNVNFGGISQGTDTRAVGSRGLFAQGFSVTAYGTHGVFSQGALSIANGTSGLFAQGTSATATGNYGSFAQGQSVTANQEAGCFAQGKAIISSGSQGSFAQGSSCTSSGDRGSFAQGNSATSSGGIGSFAQGEDVTASGGKGCFSQGLASYATGDYGCFAQGGGNFGSYVLASGNYGCFAHGYNCTASGDEGSFAQGNISTSSGSAGSFAQGRSTASGNFGSFAQGFATASGSNGSFAQGYNALASGNFGSFAQGSAVTASATGSWAVGLQALANKIGQHARSNGRFSANGDAQYSTLISRNQTTDATQTELFLDGSSSRITIASGRLYAFSILVAARQTGGSSGSAGDGWGYELKGVIKNTGGTTSLQGAVTQIILAEADTNFDVTAAADNTNDALIIQVTGAANKNVNWVATTLLTEVG